MRAGLLAPEAPAQAWLHGRRHDASQRRHPPGAPRQAPPVFASISVSALRGSETSTSSSSANTPWPVPAGLDLGAMRDMKGQHVLITGGAKGIGLNTSRWLAQLGATVHIADLDVAATQEAVASISSAVPGCKVHATPRLDLGSKASVREFASWVKRSKLPLSVLVNNAGANFMGVEPWYTEQGVAGLPQVNFLGPYTLTRLLQDRLLESPSPRIVNVASVMHRFSGLPPDPQFFLRDWWTGGSYRNCKHALVGFTALLQRDLGPAGLVAVSVDPGAVYSNIWATSRVLGRPPGSTVIKALFSTPEDACATSVHAAAAREVVPGGYYARGLFANDVIVKAAWEPWAGLMSCLDAPLRTVSRGALASGIRAVEIAPRARELPPFQQLWDACAELAGLPRETVLPPSLAKRASSGAGAPRK